VRIQLLRADVTSMKVDAMVSPSKSGEAESSANLLCKFFIPAKFPLVAAANAEVELQSATMKALEHAESLAVSSVALPPMWTKGPAEIERCARSMVQAALDFRRKARSLQLVVFCVFGTSTYEIFERALRDLDR
jgi:O-acetyl-ADP-ribose deacetylase (regulator of RNase III)